MSDYAYVTQEDNFTAIAEPYWLNSQGAYVYVDEKVPLFVDQNNYLDNHVCFIAKAENPYRQRSKVLLNYTVAALENPKEAHLHAVDAFLGKPTGMYQMVNYFSSQTNSTVIWQKCLIYHHNT